MKEPLPLPEQPRFALLIVDMQNFFFRLPERRKGLNRVASNINQLITFCEGRSFPVVHVITQYSADKSDWELKMKADGRAELTKGSAETEILPGILTSESHSYQVKTRYSAFFKTRLAEQLQREKVDSVVVTGGYTHYCVNATVFDAYGHDFVPYLIEDAVASHLTEESEVMVGRMKRNGYYVSTTKEFVARWSA